MPDKMGGGLRDHGGHAWRPLQAPMQTTVNICNPTAPASRAYDPEARAIAMGPSIEAAKSGRLWATWSTGPYAGENHANYCVLATSADNGGTWREIYVADPIDPHTRAFDPRLRIAPDGLLRWTWTERHLQNVDFDDPHNGAGNCPGNDRIRMAVLDPDSVPKSVPEVSDGGRTLPGAEARPLRHANAGLFLRRLKSGALLMVKHGGGGRIGRERLMAFVSRDGGQSWSGGLELDPRNGVACPDGAERPDGTVVVAYEYDRLCARTIHFAEFTEADAASGRDVSGKVRLRRTVSAPPCSREDYLRHLAARYETPAFVGDDPVQFARCACGRQDNAEATAFVASALSYGSRRQFLPKIAEIRDMACGDVHRWIASGAYSGTFAEGDGRSFYRLFSYGQMRGFFDCLRHILLGDGLISQFLKRKGATTGPAAVEALCKAFAGCAPVVPKDATSACKRLCLFLKWMARDSSPVDLGLWSGWFDKRTLIVPLDVHVARQARHLGITASQSASMRNALAITARLREIFPDDPLKGDFALYGLGIDEGRDRNPQAEDNR